MKPYYERNGIQIWHADCREVLPTLAAGSVDLIVTDPPYGQGYESGWRADSFGPIAGDTNVDVALAGIRAALRCLRHHRHIYMFGRYDLSKLPLTEAAELIWDKGLMGAGNLTSAWGTQHEYIQFTVYRPSAANRADGQGRLAARLRRGSVLRHPRANSGQVRHPTEKPVPLLRELIESSSCFGEMVLDPFAGVGSTLVAAQLEGRRAIGIEIEERYCEIAARRLAQDVLPFAMAE